MEIDVNKLMLGNSDSLDSSHKFVVEKKAAGDSTSVEIYVFKGGHPGVAIHFGLKDDDVIGGGSLYIDDDGNLVLGSYSRNYLGIPRDAKKRFGDLVAKKLSDDLGIKLNGIVAADSEYINKMWGRLYPQELH